MDGSVHDVYVLTWVAVAERFRGLGVGQRLYSVALETAGDSAMLVFAEAESAGDLLLRKCLSRSRGILHPLGAYQALGVVCRESRRPVHEAGDLRPGEIDSLPGAAGAIAAMPSAAQVQHHAAYPLRSAWIAVRDSAGRIVGAVFGLLPEGGSGAVAVVLAVGSPDVNGAALPEVAGAFARILGRQPVIVVENDRFVDRAAIRTVVRPLGPSFNGYLHCGAAHPLAQAHHTISEML